MSDGRLELCQTNMTHCDECCGVDKWMSVGQGTWSQCAYCGEMRLSIKVPKRRVERWFWREPTRPYSAVVAMLLSQRHRFAAESERLREFAETVVAMCEPMDPPAYSPVPDPIRTVLLNLARAAL